MSQAFECLEPQSLELFLERRRRAETDFPSETSLAGHLVEILSKANEFVPSDDGAILLDDPTRKHVPREPTTLTFIASFGDRARALLGRQMDAASGIAGHVYNSGEAYFTADAAVDDVFNDGLGERAFFTGGSLIAIPIQIGNSVCGVLELIRSEPYSAQDCQLLAIFAGYISISIQNVLDARIAQAIAKRDNLTNLYNDRYLHVALSEWIQRCRDEDKDLSILFLDLDHFKRINDTHGHLAGSQVLREVGGLLRRSAREHEGFAARYGGDEFVVLLPGTALERGVDLAEEIRTQISTTTYIADHGSIQPEPLYLKGLTCSIGAASLHRHARDRDPDRVKTTLLHLADAAMYVAKETGRNRTAIAGEPVPRRDSEEPRRDPLPSKPTLGTQETA